jgi:hypothetical protein
VRRKLAIVLSAVVLAGCVGREYPPGSPVPGSTGVYPAVLLFGDSLLEQASSWVSPSLAWHGVDAPVVDRAIGGVGVLDDGFEAYTDDVYSSAPPGSVVVLQFSGNCFFGPGGGCPHTPGTQPFYDAWRASLTRAVERAYEVGLQPLLVVSPYFGPAAGGHADTVRWVRAVTEQVAAATSTPMVDWGDALHDVNDAYQELLWYADLFAAPAWHVVRRSDGVHLDGEGGRRAASWTAYAIGRL